MRNIFVAETVTAAAVVRNLLVANGIDAQIIEGATSAYPDLATEVWIPQDIQRDRALKLIRNLYSDSQNDSLWCCASCAESNPGQFELCWSCGKTLE